MTQKKAYDITRSFYCYVGGSIRSLSSQKPIKDKDFYFITYKTHIYIAYKDENNKYINIKYIKKSKHLKHYKSKSSFYEIYTYFDGDFYQKSRVDKLNEQLVFTSIGFVSLLEYYEALDLVDRKKIKTKDLIIGEKYMSISGKEYHYIGYKEEKHRCLNKKNKKLLLSSLKLIELI